MDSSIQEISFISLSEKEEKLFALHNDKFIFSFLKFYKEHGAVNDGDHRKAGKKLSLSMHRQIALMRKAQEVRYCFIKLLAAFEVWNQNKENKESEALFQYLQWYSYFLFQLYIYKEFSFRLVNSLFPEIYGYDENTLLLTEQMRLREKSDSAAELPADLRRLYSFFDDVCFKDQISLRTKLTHKELLQIITEYRGSRETLRIVWGMDFTRGREVNPAGIRKAAQKAYGIFANSCNLLGEMYSKKLKEWLVSK